MVHVLLCTTPASQIRGLRSFTGCKRLDRTRFFCQSQIFMLYVPRILTKPVLTLNGSCMMSFSNKVVLLGYFLPKNPQEKNALLTTRNITVYATLF